MSGSHTSPYPPCSSYSNEPCSVWAGATRGARTGIVDAVGDVWLQCVWSRLAESPEIVTDHVGSGKIGFGATQTWVQIPTLPLTV
jgi:hypothetical protein